MRAYRIAPGRGIDGLSLAEMAPAPLGPYDIRVRVAAASLNYRDLMIATGRYAPSDREVTPLSDGAGEVIEIGRAVSRFRPGDRVVASFWPDWIAGPISAATTGASLGFERDGLLAEQFVSHEAALVRAPETLGLDEAATMPCAGVTAWNALFVEGRIAPGATVLVLGTGGVAIWAIQLAVAAGMKPIVLSSSDDKLDRVRRLGAEAVVNYREVTDWERRVLALTDGVGADLVLELGGEATIARSLAATRAGGTVAVIGGVTGFGGASVSPGMLVGSGKRLIGIAVGNRTMLEQLVRFVDHTGIRPVLDRRFDFGDAPAAYRHLEAAGHLGKVVVVRDAAA